jgi:hypothetical protein
MARIDPPRTPNSPPEMVPAVSHRSVYFTGWNLDADYCSGMVGV